MNTNREDMMSNGFCQYDGPGCTEIAEHADTSLCANCRVLHAADLETAAHHPLNRGTK
jgi:hypothetical protein